ncbi:DUF6520 family protein [Zunongwangia sp. H14]|uniref:DUF6520 family protein n=1 Tax=Zunongwangia sp. H14 TaxID=3240792 RepID=UPI0035637E31
MNIRKLILPMLAIVFAIGMAFATVDVKPEPKLQVQDFIILNGSWQAIPEQDCEPGDETCRVKLGDSGLVYDVYDQMDQSTLKSSTSENPNVINLQ